MFSADVFSAAVFGAAVFGAAVFGAAVDDESRPASTLGVPLQTDPSDPKRGATLVSNPRTGLQAEGVCARPVPDLSSMIWIRMICIRMI